MSSNSPESDTAALSPTTNWSTVSKHAINSYREANNAFLAVMGLSTANVDDPSCESNETAADSNSTIESETTVTDSPLTEVAFGDETWLVERSTDDHDQLGVGEYVHFTKPITDTDVSAFAQVSGDTNRLHLEEPFATNTQFDGRIAHGTLVAGTISAALARFPGLTVYLSQDLEFHAPVEIGDVVTAECEIVEELGDGRYRVRTTVAIDDGSTVIDGEAVVVIRPLPAVDRSAEQ